jgi:hypothetical protein
MPEFGNVAVRDLVRPHRYGQVDRRKELWTLLTFHRWYQAVLVPSPLVRSDSLALVHSISGYYRG